VPTIQVSPLTVPATLPVLPPPVWGASHEAPPAEQGVWALTARYAIRQTQSVHNSLRSTNLTIADRFICL